MLPVAAVAFLEAAGVAAAAFLEAVGGAAVAAAVTATGVAAPAVASLAAAGVAPFYCILLFHKTGQLAKQIT